ncbi:hypothetical protein [Paraburkholderia sp. DGU8]|uniref:hypothetical protein n=1 Tax=Paraburkholderia sp. DGU8 TaxID=3161997 RepID=UPI0034655A66
MSRIAALGSVRRTWLSVAYALCDEPFITSGVCLAFLGLMFFKQPLVTRRRRA